MEDAARAEIVRHLSAVPDEKQAKLDAARLRQIDKLGAGGALPAGMTVDDVDALRARVKKSQAGKKVNPAFHIPGADDRQVFNEAKTEFIAVKRRSNDDSVSVRVQISAEMKHALDVLVKRDDNTFVTAADVARHGLVLSMYEQIDRTEMPEEVAIAIKHHVAIQDHENQKNAEQALIDLEDSLDMAQRKRQPQRLEKLLVTVDRMLELEEEDSTPWNTLTRMKEKYS